MDETLTSEKDFVNDIEDEDTTSDISTSSQAKTVCASKTPNGDHELIMENSKCIISPNTHRPVVNSAGNVIIQNNKLILFNVPGNTIVRVPITNGLEQMFKITPRPILASCEEERELL
ncbi:hypothetical protein RN001_005943 [Aquatica leii]|uniref:Uncharacterized protein n=1 Tax=Aquatica leii TaxID=1421715 RepID=A0AAN7PCZ9_9COLE|nr:hypothetical protein RN001_005943 [Aquatica leii]